MATFEELLAQSLGSGAHRLTAQARPVRYRTTPKRQEPALNDNIAWYCVPCCMLVDALYILGAKCLDFAKRSVRWFRWDVDNYDELLSAL